MQHRIDHEIVRAWARPGSGEDVVVKYGGVICGVVVGGEGRAVPNDVPRNICAGAIAGGWQRNAIVGKVKSGDVGGEACPPFLCYMNKGVVQENKTASACTGASFVQDGVVNIIEKIVDDGPLGELIRKIDSA